MMKEPVIIVWGVLAIITGFWLKWCLKRYGRQPDSTTPIHLFVFALLCSIAAVTIQLTMKASIHTVWVSRLVLLVIGSLHVWSLYRQSLAKRDPYSYEKDSYITEIAFTSSLAFVCSICFVLSPRLLSLLKIAKTPSDLTLWDAPLVFLLPLLVYKLFDLAGQVPFRYVENTWFYPLETVNVEKWPWRDLVRVNFRVTNSLLDEYLMFGRKADPWIEIPKEATLGNIFRLTMQERRKKQGLSTIQDLGTEYGGEPKFWWLFKVKFIWWRPSTWTREPRFLNPDLSITANKILNDDVIVAKRLPASKEQLPINRPWDGRMDYDPDKTVILNR